ncbi:nocardicin N-oxygenase [Micromonospora pallida]|uniref:Nocardicin N-oxygenase n=1 Tax=Micromonospora pallida TaxID=145854 RepID=A0A1C6S3K8_9ACTN|nr:cytochrome P450 [Micromonospora pallida]SCL23844.1 nocardicin N-oxygenase [Micromonospora pallida]
MRPTDQTPDYPFLDYAELGLSPQLDAARRGGTLIRVRLPYAGEAWLATGYRDVRKVMTDPRFSRAAAMAPDVPRQTPDPPFVSTIMDVDRPEHGRLRRLVAVAFTERRIDGLRPYVREVAHGLIDDMLRQGPPTDLTQALALPLPMTVICRTLGVPLADQTEFRRWTESLLALRKITAEEFRAVVDALEAYLRDLIRQRREQPTDDLLSALVSARDDGSRLTEQELLAFGVTLLAAGFETTASHIASSTYLLLTRPGLWEDLVTEPDRMATTVEELLRFVPLNGGTGLSRVALEDVEFDGVTVRAGEAVFVSTISGNRDEEAFPEADTFRLDRDPEPHLAFGWGPHRCLGARLATMELHEALAALRERVPTLRLAVPPGSVSWKAGTVLRGPRELPVTW